QKAAWYDGSNDYVDMGTLDIDGNRLTILAWFKVDAFDTTEPVIISKATGVDTADNRYWAISLVNSGGSNFLRFRVRTNGSTQTLVATSGAIATGTWVFVAATFDGGTMKLFKDGSLVGSASKSGNLDTSSKVRIFVGDNPPGSSRARY